jgi:spore coat protein U-like protein
MLSPASFIMMPERKMIQRVARTLGIIAALVLPAAAHAAVSCRVAATGPAFGTYSPTNTAATVANGTLTATCTLTGGTTTAVTLTSSYSTGSSGTFSSRVMLSGTSRLSYNLYYDAAYTQIRGDGTGGSQTGSATMTLTRAAPTQDVESTIYGRVTAGQDVAPGTYTDTITITVTY